jgi:hypothetical protein
MIPSTSGVPPMCSAAPGAFVLIPTPPVALIRNWSEPVEEKKSGSVVVLSDQTNVPVSKA